MGLVLVAGEGNLLEVSEDGVVWEELPYAGSISSTGGEAPETDVVTFREVGKLTGKRRVPSISVGIPSYVAQPGDLGYA